MSVDTSVDGVDGVEGVSSVCREQCSNLTGITSPDNQTRSWLTSQNNQKVVLTGIQYYHFGPGGRKRGLIDLHVPSSPPTDTCIPQNNHSTSNTISFLAVSDLLRLFPAVSGHILTFSRALEQSDAGVTAEYGPARAQKNQTGKWYPQIPVDHTTLQINQRVVNTTLIPVKVKH